MNLKIYIIYKLRRLSVYVWSVATKHLAQKRLSFYVWSGATKHRANEQISIDNRSGNIDLSWMGGLAAD